MIEANPNPQIAKGKDFAASADAAGLTYDALIQRGVSTRHALRTYVRQPR